MEDNRKHIKRRSTGGSMISSNTIIDISKKEGIGWHRVEKDYFLTLLLECISNNSELKKVFVFKGGTALRKIYFNDYRYSEDLDFTLKDHLTEKQIEDALNNVFGYSKKEHNVDFRIKSFYHRKWFTDIKIQFVGLKGEKNTITIDLSPDETIVDEIKERLIFNPYYEKTFSIPVYSLEEILAEKLRSFLQRTRVRDYYDAWYLLTHAKNNIDTKKMKEIFIKKVDYKKLKFSDKTQLLDERKIEEARAYYQRQISDQIRKPPSFDQMITELKKGIMETNL